MIWSPSYGEKFDEYKMIGTAKLQKRAEQLDNYWLVCILNLAI